MNGKNNELHTLSLQNGCYDITQHKLFVINILPKTLLQF